MNVVIHRDAATDCYDSLGGTPLNLGEVKLFTGQSQLSASNLTFTLSSTLSSPSYPAVNCNDGNVSTLCSSSEDGSDPSPTLTVGTSFQSFDRVVVYNRAATTGADAMCRIIGATVRVVGALSGSVYSSWVISTAAPSYSYTIRPTPGD